MHFSGHKLHIFAGEMAMNETTRSLLAADEPVAVTVLNASGRSPFLLVADHAGNRMPRSVAGLGIPAAERERHIAWDIGIAAIGRLLAEAIDATLIQQNYSRLVIDCNRPPGTLASIPEISELTAIPGNEGLTEADRDARARDIFWPYHQAIESELDRRKGANPATALIALHSFTPVFKGVARAMQAALLYNRDPRLARKLLELLRQDQELIVGDNEPYFVSDTTDYTIPVHGERRGLLHVLIEIRQDLIADEPGQRQWAASLARLLPEAYQHSAA
jgi:predicted N-formylglutamate amidohydrolase